MAGVFHVILEGSGRRRFHVLLQSCLRWRFGAGRTVMRAAERGRHRRRCARMMRMMLLLLMVLLLRRMQMRLVLQAGRTVNMRCHRMLRLMRVLLMLRMLRVPMVVRLRFDVDSQLQVMRLVAVAVVHR